MNLVLDSPLLKKLNLKEYENFFICSKLINNMTIGGFLNNETLAKNFNNKITLIRFYIPQIINYFNLLYGVKVFSIKKKVNASQQKFFVFS